MQSFDNTSLFDCVSLLHSRQYLEILATGFRLRERIEDDLLYGDKFQLLYHVVKESTRLHL